MAINKKTGNTNANTNASANDDVKAKANAGTNNTEDLLQSIFSKLEEMSARIDENSEMSAQAMRNSKAALEGAKETFKEKVEAAKEAAKEAAHAESKEEAEKADEEKGFFSRALTKHWKALATVAAVGVAAVGTTIAVRSYKDTGAPLDEDAAAASVEGDLLNTSDEVKF